MQEHFLEDNKDPSAHIYYRVNDSVDNRPTVLFIHGLSGSSSAWVEYENKFKDNYNVISYDLRGHGKSKRYDKYIDYQVSEFVNDIHILLKHLNIKKLFIVSHSFGTLFALDFVLQYQDMIEGVVFLSPNFNIDKKWLGTVMLPVTKSLELLPSNSKTNIKKVGRHIDYSKYLNSGDWNIPRMIDDVGNTGLKSYLFCTRQVCDFDRMELLKDLHVPVLIIHGKKDTIFPVKNSVNLVGKIKNLELLTLEKSDHILVLNNFKEVSSAIEKFVEKNV
jgi:pimeloyl-ACP methyl ester carboxylesterase